MTDTPDAPDPTTDPTSYYVPPKFRSAIWASEGGPGTGLNKYGYAGAYQFGTAALNDAGLYTPADGESLSKNEWKGKITIPGYQPMTVQDFIGNQGAQDAAFNAHMHNLAVHAHSMGLDSYIGQTIGGVPITQESLAAMMHGAGPGRTKQFLESGGLTDPPDGFGTTVANAGAKVHNYMTGLPTVMVANTGAPPVSPVSGYVPLPTSLGPQTAAAGLSPQLLRLAQLQSLNNLMPQQRTQTAALNTSGPYGWGNALLNANNQIQPFSPVQSIVNAERLKMLADGSTGSFNPLLTA